MNFILNMDYKDLSKVSDDYIKKSDRLDVPSGAPSDLNLLDFRESLSTVNKPLIRSGIVSEGSDKYLGIMVKVPEGFELHSLKEPMHLVGTAKKGNDLIAYYRPASGWKTAQIKEE